MSFLLPRTVPATVVSAQPVSIHGDVYLDLRLAPDEAPDALLVSRVTAGECLPGLAPGERVEARVVMGNVVRIERA